LRHDFWFGPLHELLVGQCLFKLDNKRDMSDEKFNRDENAPQVNI